MVFGGERVGTCSCSLALGVTWLVYIPYDMFATFGNVSYICSRKAESRL